MHSVCHSVDTESMMVLHYAMHNYDLSVCRFIEMYLFITTFYFTTVSYCLAFKVYSYLKVYFKIYYQAIIPAIS